MGCGHTTHSLHINQWDSLQLGLWYRSGDLDQDQTPDHADRVLRWVKQLRSINSQPWSVGGDLRSSLHLDRCILTMSCLVIQFSCKAESVSPKISCTMSHRSFKTDWARQAFQTGKNLIEQQKPFIEEHIGWKTSMEHQTLGCEMTKTIECTTNNVFIFIQQYKEIFFW